MTSLLLDCLPVRTDLLHRLPSLHSRMPSTKEVSIGPSEHEISKYLRGYSRELFLKAEAFNLRVKDVQGELIPSGN